MIPILVALSLVMAPPIQRPGGQAPAPPPTVQAPGGAPPTTPRDARPRVQVPNSGGQTRPPEREHALPPLAPHLRLGPGLGPSPSIDRFEFTAPSELEATPLLSKAGKGAVLGVGTAIFLGGVIFAAARCSPSTGARCISMPTSGAAAAAMIAGGLGVNLVALVLFAVDRRK